MAESYIKVDRIPDRTCEFAIEIDKIKFMADAISLVHGHFDHVDGVDSILCDVAEKLRRIADDIYGNGPHEIES